MNLTSQSFQSSLSLVPFVSAPGPAALVKGPPQTATSRARGRAGKMRTEDSERRRTPPATGTRNVKRVLDLNSLARGPGLRTRRRPPPVPPQGRTATTVRRAIDRPVARLSWLSTCYGARARTPPHHASDGRRGDRASVAGALAPRNTPSLSRQEHLRSASPPPAPAPRRRHWASRATSRSNSRAS